MSTGEVSNWTQPGTVKHAEIARWEGGAARGPGGRTPPLRAIRISSRTTVPIYTSPIFKLGKRDPPAAYVLSHNKAKVKTKYTHAVKNYRSKPISWCGNRGMLLVLSGQEVRRLHSEGGAAAARGRRPQPTCSRVHYSDNHSRAVRPYTGLTTPTWTKLHLNRLSLTFPFALLFV